MPDVASVPLKAISTGWLYQPFASGPRLGEPPLSDGGVASFLTSKSATTLVGGVPPYVTSQWKCCPVVSELTVCVSHPLVEVTPTGSQANATVMLVLYQSGEQAPP